MPSLNNDAGTTIIIDNEDGAATFSRMTLRIMTVKSVEFILITLSLMALGKMTFITMTINLRKF
jgi:hypothetical protein